MLAAGAYADRQTGAYSIGSPFPYAFDGRANDTTAYVEARAGDARASFDAGLGVTDVTAASSLSPDAPSGTHLALLPSLSTRFALGGGAYARAAYSESARLPTELETQSLYPRLGTPGFERGELVESALGFDDGARVRGEAILYREFTHGFDERRLDGLGVSLVWQVAPLVSIRAWSLRASPLTFGTPNPEPDASRQVLWTTYEKNSGLRFDAIVHRDVSAFERPVLAFDTDVLVPLFQELAIDAGTRELSGARRFYVGLRARH